MCEFENKQNHNISTKCKKNYKQNIVTLWLSVELGK